MALKFAGKFKEGEVIRAYDFQPRDGYSSSYIEGKILEPDYVRENAEQTFNCYKIELTKRVFVGQAEAHVNPDGTPQFGFVPHQCTFDYDDRICLVTAHAPR